MNLLIGSSNKGKYIEMSEALRGLEIHLLKPSDMDITASPNETGETFHDNARQKTRFYYGQSNGCPTLADDSGIIVEALENELGVHTRRWGAGPDVSDAHWIDFFLDRMRREQNKRARFVCVLCFIDADGIEHFFEGSCDGMITDELKADYLPGLPISACFKPDGFDKVYSALTIDEKNSVSHRGRAMAKCADFIKSILP